MQHKRVVLRHRIWRAAIVGISALGLAVAGLGITTASAKHTTLDRVCLAPRCIADVKYGPEPEHELDIYPMNNGGVLAPTVVVVFGGGWIGGSRNGVANVAETLAAEGFAVFNIDYRLATPPPGAGGLSGVEDRDGLNQTAHDPALGPADPSNSGKTGDIERAVQWIKANGALYGADVSNISLIGGSAGAQLVATAGQFLNMVKPGTIRSVVELSGPMDFLDMVQNHAVDINEGMPSYLGCPVVDAASTPKCTEAQLKDPSPRYNIHPDSPRYMLVNGANEILPVEQAQIFHNALIAAGETSVLDIVGGTAAARHGFNLFPTEQVAIVKFLKAVDTPGPSVTKKTPTVHKNGVAPATNVSATFSEPVTGISKGTFTLRNATGNVIDADVTYDASTRVAKLNPTLNLPTDSQYTVTLSGGTQAQPGIIDAAGNRLPSTVWKFTVGPKPKVTGMVPENAVTGVPRAANVSVTFNEPVAAVSTASFTLKTTATTDADAAVSAVVVRSGTSNTWILDPSGPLAANTNYTATVTGAPATGGIRDIAGNLLVTTKWTFTTGA